MELATVQPGDLLVKTTNFNHGEFKQVGDPRVVEVVRVTPTQIFIRDSDRAFGKDGRSKTSKRSLYVSTLKLPEEGQIEHLQFLQQQQYDRIEQKAEEALKIEDQAKQIVTDRIVAGSRNEIQRIVEMAMSGYSWSELEDKTN